jgi:membrane protein implicated in regulation of membrane protease activity
MAVMIIGIATTRPEFAFLRGMDLTSAAVYFFAAVFVSLLLWKSYQEYWKNSNDESS